MYLAIRICGDCVTYFSNCVTFFGDCDILYNKIEKNLVFLNDYWWANQTQLIDRF